MLVEVRWAAIVDFWFQLDAMYAMYDGQFKRSGSGFVYRYKNNGEEYRLTRGQRDQLVSSARRDLRRAIVLPTIGYFAAFAILLWLFAPSAENWPPWQIVASIALPLALLGAVSGYLAHRTWQRPLRELSKEQVEKPALEPQVARRQFFATRSYGMIAALPLIFASLLFTRRDLDLWQGHGRYLWLVPLGGTLLAAWLAYSKWRAERGD